MLTAGEIVDGKYIIISVLGNVISFMICETIVQIIKRKKR